MQGGVPLKQEYRRHGTLSNIFQIHAHCTLFYLPLYNTLP
jgi:hypothetical protein